jgi:hypothetical protein
MITMEETLEEFRERVLSSNLITDDDIIKWYWELSQEFMRVQEKIAILERGCACFRQSQIGKEC